MATPPAAPQSPQKSVAGTPTLNKKEDDFKTLFELPDDRLLESMLLLDTASEQESRCVVLTRWFLPLSFRFFVCPPAQVIAPPWTHVHIRQEYLLLCQYSWA
jgi:hypothetical protein